jgi:hypothetical protein
MSWQAGTVVFLIYLAVVGLVRPGLAGHRRFSALGCVAAAAALLSLSFALPGDHGLNVWIIPPTLLFIGYWGSGRLFVRPSPALERALLAGDRALRIDAIAARMPGSLVELLELSYTGIYPLMPIALFFALREGVSADRFWTVVVVTDYICFGMLPWFQTRPPRSAGAPVPWRSHWRGLNVLVLDRTSVQVNTFPSGHAAEALAAFLLVSGAAWPIALAMFTAALLISAATVFGRYHYAADAFAGWVVALVVFALA